jgi:hypothetical protein
MNDNDIRTRTFEHASVAAGRVVEKLSGERKARMFESLRLWLGKSAGDPRGSESPAPVERSRDGAPGVKR